MDRPLRIFFVINESGCAFWRGRLPAEHISRNGLAEVRVFSMASVARDEIESLFVWADTVVVQSPAGVETVVNMLPYKLQGKKIICDYDDLIFNATPFNPAYKTLGLKEVKVKDKEGNWIWLWKDGVEGFSLKDNHMRFLSVQDLLHLSDKISVTTDYLKGKYVNLLKESAHPDDKVDWKNKVCIIPNSIDFEKFAPFQEKKKDHSQVRIGWTCSSSHLSELWMVEDIIIHTYEKYGDKIKFVIMGDVSELTKSPRLPQKALEFHLWTDISVYPLKLASLEIDVGICPLQQNAFNDCKSQLKWSEFGALHIPSVVSKSPAYDCVKDGEDGLVAYADNETTDKEWIEKLSLLVEDEAYRKKMGEAAYERNYNDFNISKNAQLWVNEYQKTR